MKEDFPILKREVNGKRLVYLDNAATTQKPKQVIDVIKDFYEKHNSNIHRGIHTLAEEATEAYENVREKAAKLINANPEEIVFTRGTTEGLNLVAYSLLASFEKGSKVLATEMEHHSNFVPWQQACRFYGLNFDVVNLNDNAEIDFEDLKRKIKGARLISVSHVSNVTGILNDIKKISEIAKENNCLVVVDGAQAVNSTKVDVKELNVDFYSFSGHKMMGPTGIGVLYGRKELLEKMRPFNMGGGMIREVKKDETTWNEIPYKFEAGTQNIAGVIGLGVAIDYINKIGIDKIKEHEEKLATIAYDKIKKIEGVKVYGRRGDRPIVSFNIERVHSHDAAAYLDSLGIAVRAGNHCAAPLMDKFGVKGTVRASFYIYNDEDDVKSLVEGIKKTREFFTK